MIYVITASRGDYSDRSEWVVVAYTNEAEAKQHVEFATRWANAAHERYLRTRYTQAAPVPLVSPWDGGTNDEEWDHTTYYVEQVELLAALPTAAEYGKK